VLEAAAAAAECVPAIIVLLVIEQFVAVETLCV
jgi:hypothetical protein